MKKKLLAFLSAALLLALLSHPVFGETISCAECGMTSDIASKFTAKIVQGDKTLYFCDIGDLFAYMHRKKLQSASAGVRDFNSGEWLDSQKAYYVHDGKKFNSPMGWGFASFKDRKEASAFGTVMDFESALKAVR